MDSQGIAATHSKGSKEIRFDGFPIRKNREKSEKIGENRNKSEKVRFTGVRHQIQPDSTTTAWNRKKSEKSGKISFGARQIGKNRKNRKKSEKSGKSVSQTMETNGFHWIQAITIESGKIRKNQKKSEKIGINQKKSEKVSFEGNQ